MPIFKKFGAFAAIGTIGCVGVSIFMDKKRSAAIKNSELGREVLKTLREHKGAVALLGEPIVDGKAEFDNVGLYFSDHSDAKIQVTGSKSKGQVFFTIVEDEIKKLKVASILLQIGGDKTKRLVIKESENQQTA